VAISPDAAGAGPSPAASVDAAGAPGSGAPSRPESPRVRLARLAATAATARPGVVRLDGGPRDHWTTFAGEQRIPGVVVIADDAPGRYAASVYLHAQLTDLPALADEVRAAVRAAASEHGLADRLGEVRVAITDIDDGTPPA
jgi:hypothetical protein